MGANEAGQLAGNIFDAVRTHYKENIWPHLTDN